MILDVGAGSAFFLKEARKIFTEARCIAMDPNYTIEQSQLVNGIEYTKSSLGIQADLYLMVDVLEHIEDDLIVLSNYVNHAPSGSVFLISVPAFEFLWSPHDVFLGHFRRYTIKTLTTLVESSRLECLESHYLFGPIFPIVYLTRKIRSLNKNKPANSDMKKPSMVENVLLTRLLKSSRWPNINGIVGTSVFVVARKR